MKIIVVGLIISVLAISSVALTTSPVIQASSKGLKLYLTVDTNLGSQDIRIDTEQYGRHLYTHDGFMNAGLNEYTLNYPSNLIENGDFRVCVTTQSGDDWYNCGNGYNSREKKPEHVFVNLVVEERNVPMFDVQDQSQSQSQSQSNNQEQSNAHSQNNDQKVIIYNCPADSKCVIEQ